MLKSETKQYLKNLMARYILKKTSTKIIKLTYEKY